MTPSTAGAPGKAVIEGIPEFKTKFNVNVDGKNVEASRYATVNGQLQTPLYSIQPGDEVKVLDYNTAAQIAELLDIELTEDTVIMVNNERGDKDTPVYENFKVEFKSQDDMIMDYYKDYPTAEEVAIRQENEEAIENEEEAAKIVEDSNGQLSFEAPIDTEVYEKEEAEPVKNILAHDLHVIVNNDPVTLHGKADYVFVDVFDAIDFDLSKPQGRSVVTILNGGTPDYLQSIKEGDKIEVYWK